MMPSTNTCGDCGQVVNRYGHAPGCFRLRAAEAADGDDRVETALQNENGRSPKARAHYVEYLAEQAAGERPRRDEGRRTP